MNGQIRNLVLDLSSAMFRVAAVIGHEALRSEVEKAAISLSVSADHLSIDRAESIILLGREVEEIKHINAAVLIRELNSLRRLIDEELISKREVDLTASFAAGTSASDAISNGKPATVKTDSAKPLVKPLAHENGGASNAQKKYNAVNPNMVFGYIKDKGTAKLKELETAFPSVSGRTIRRITDQLIKEKMIERVGNPGPTSYYRPKPLVSGNTVPTTVDFLPAAPLESPFARQTIQEIADPHKFSF